MRRASKAGHSTSLTFFNTYAICLFKSQSKNEKKKNFFKNFRGPKFCKLATFWSISKQINKTFYGGPSHSCPSNLCVNFIL